MMPILHVFAARFFSCVLTLVVLTCAAMATGESGPVIQFADIATHSGIRFVHYKGNSDAPMILADQTPGVCVADFDGDGWQDIYFVNGRDLKNPKNVRRNALYHNNGDGTFTDVTEKAGVPGTGYGLGCVWGDYNNDGFPDLYVSQYGLNVLYRNNGDGTFTDVTDKAGVGGMEFGSRVHAGAVFLDYDRDGYLDLYVGGYVAFGPDSPQSCIVYGVRTSCAPGSYDGSPPLLYHNNGDGTFTNVTKQAGLFQPHGKNLAVGAADYDNDGWPDIFVANDGVVAYLYHNEHNGTFKEIGLLAGMAVGEEGRIMAGMCISLADYNNDGWLDLYISDWQGATDHLWQNNGKGGFIDVTEDAGLAHPTREHMSFGGGFFDYDNDGWLDLFIGNGHVFPFIEQVFHGIRYKQLNSLFHNQGDGKFEETTKYAGPGFSVPHLARGVAFVDFDNDGFMDVVVANDGEAPLLLHNSGGDHNHFVNFKLVGVKSNRDGIGARVRVVAGGLPQIREIQSGGSYMSQSDLRANFGLGKATRVDSVDVTWPSGERQVFKDLDVDKFYRVVEGADKFDLQNFARKASNPLHSGQSSLPSRKNPPPVH
jgi:enediyne biosynthesis protein E4